MFSIRPTSAELPRSVERQPHHQGWHEQSLSSTEEVTSTVQAVLVAMVNQDYPKTELFGTCLATEEALVNALKHGNQSDPTKRVRVRYRVDAERVLVQVADEGRGFDRERVPDPLAAENLERPNGRGLFLMRSFMTWIRFNRRGNIVTLCKYRAIPPTGLPWRKEAEGQKVSEADDADEPTKLLHCAGMRMPSGGRRHSS